MMYGDPQQQQQLPPPPQPHGGDFHRGGPLPPPPPIMRQSSAASTNMPPEYHHQSGPPPPYEAPGDSFSAKRMRKLTQRRAVDYTSTVVRYMQIRMWQRDCRDKTVLQPTPAAAIDMLPAFAYSDNPSTSFATKFVHTSLNKNRCPINRVLWTPTGRRLITGSQSGEFTLWNGQSFNFEMILQAHDQAVRSMVWSHNENWMVTGDDGGAIKYWQNNLNNVKANKTAHKESVRDLSFCKTDLKFCSCSDDRTVKVWDFARCQEERSLSGHGWDVKCVDWHPTKSLLVSGGKDNLVKLWDAKSGRELSSFHGHKNTVLCVKWNQNGNWVLTGSKDQIIKLYDIRTMKELESFRGHRKDVTALAWHPFHEEYFVSGSFDGSIYHWIVGHENPQVEMFNAHDNSVWDLAWHPIGYILCSGSNDHTTKFWCRNRPGDTARDKNYMGHSQGYGEQNSAIAGRVPGSYPIPDVSTTPGPFTGGFNRNDGTIPGVGVAMSISIPSLDTSGLQKQPPLPPGPHPSVLAAHQQLPYQHNPRQMSQQHQSHQQQSGSLPLPPNLPQPPSHMPLLQHPPLPRLPHMPPINMSSALPSSMQGSLPLPSSMSTSGPLQMPGPMGMPVSMNQMTPSVQGHFMSINPIHSGSLSSGGQAGPSGVFPSGLQNMQGLQNPGGNQMYPSGGPLNRASAGQISLMHGVNPYQSGSSNASGMGTSASNIGLPSSLQPPLPPGPPPHGQTPQ